MTQNQERHEQNCSLDSLNAAIAQILTGDNPHAYSDIVAVERHLRQFHLFPQVEAFEIYHEAYLRARKFIEQGGIIYNPKYWLKGAAFKIVREKSRKQRREHPTDPQSAVFENSLPSNDNNTINTIDQRLESLYKAIAILGREDPEVAKLMRWRLLDHLSWKEIQQRLIQELGKAPSEETLRQRACRAKRRLRRIYHEIEGETGGVHKTVSD